MGLTSSCFDFGLILPHEAGHVIVVLLPGILATSPIAGLKRSLVQSPPHPGGCSSMAELLVPNQVTRVRFPSPAPLVPVILGAMLYWRSATQVAKQAKRGHLAANVAAILIALCGTLVLTLDAAGISG
jgi:hypothetical protein